LSRWPAVDLAAGHLGCQRHVDDTGDGVRAIGGGSAARDDIDMADQLAGITLTLKPPVGLVPRPAYRRSAPGYGWTDVAQIEGAEADIWELLLFWFGARDGISAMMFGDSQRGLLLQFGHCDSGGRSSASKPWRATRLPVTVTASVP